MKVINPSTLKLPLTSSFICGLTERPESPNRKVLLGKFLGTVLIVTQFCESI